MKKMKKKSEFKNPQNESRCFKQDMYINHAWTLYVYLKVQPSYKSIGLGHKKLIWLLLCAL
jgi:hypothetical protein